jgi:hypothetical protein
LQKSAMVGGDLVHAGERRSVGEFDQEVAHGGSFAVLSFEIGG